MNIKAIGLWVMLSGCGFGVSAQQKIIHPLSIGDKMPDLVFDSLIGFHKPSMKMEEYRNKLVIFDFWSTWCHWCIEAFPKNDSLQQAFGNKMIIMLVDCKTTGDTKKAISAFYQKRVAADKKFRLPTIYSDTVLEQLFPHQLIPHYVWVKDGIVKAITSSEAVNAVNIRKMLNGEQVDLEFKGK